VLNLLTPTQLWEQPLLPVLDVLSAGWARKRPAHGGAAEMMPKITQDRAHSSWTTVQLFPLLTSNMYFALNAPMLYIFMLYIFNIINEINSPECCW